MSYQYLPFVMYGMGAILFSLLAIVCWYDRGESKARDAASVGRPVPIVKAYAATEASVRKALDRPPLLASPSSRRTHDTQVLPGSLAGV